MTVTAAEWSVEHGCFYLTVSIPGPVGIVVRDVSMRVIAGEVAVTPPPCLDWPAEWAEQVKRSAVKRLVSIRNAKSAEGRRNGSRRKTGTATARS